MSQIHPSILAVHFSCGLHRGQKSATMVGVKAREGLWGQSPKDRVTFTPTAENLGLIQQGSQGVEFQFPRVDTDGLFGLFIGVLDEFLG